MHMAWVLFLSMLTSVVAVTHYTPMNVFAHSNTWTIILQLIYGACGFLMLTIRGDAVFSGSVTWVLIGMAIFHDHNTPVYITCVLLSVFLGMSTFIAAIYHIFRGTRDRAMYETV